MALGIQGKLTYSKHTISILAKSILIMNFKPGYLLVILISFAGFLNGCEVSKQADCEQLVNVLIQNEGNFGGLKENVKYQGVTDTTDENVTALESIQVTDEKIKEIKEGFIIEYQKLSEAQRGMANTVRNYQNINFYSQKAEEALKNQILLLDDLQTYCKQSNTLHSTDRSE